MGIVLQRSYLFKFYFKKYKKVVTYDIISRLKYGIA
ncbi:MAG: hypothetical protein RI894_1113 [Bacteroidota bacterium]|jgi:hypothetical protein